MIWLMNDAMNTLDNVIFLLTTTTIDNNASQDELWSHFARHEALFFIH